MATNTLSGLVLFAAQIEACRPEAWHLDLSERTYSRGTTNIALQRLLNNVDRAPMLWWYRNLVGNRGIKGI